jgi:hypothetical protein
VFWTATGAIGGTDVAESGMTRLNEETGICEELETTSSKSENDLLDGLSAAIWPPLPDVGEWLEMGAIYSYDDTALMVRQSHSRMHYDPLETPALFIVYREDAGEALEWIAGEQVYVGTWRMYDGTLYECLQQHVTQADWTPDVVPALWRVVPTTAEWQPWVYYEIGTHVTYQGIEYECRQSHTSQPGWTPPAVPALWLAV